VFGFGVSCMIGLDHESLSIFVRFAPILLSVLDPTSAVVDTELVLTVSPGALNLSDTCGPGH
jgi:hypothetical protein